ASARPRANGRPTGLRWLYGHRHPNAGVRDRDRSENLWSDEIAASLLPRGITAKREPYYPGTRHRGDLILGWDSVSFWIEVKRWYRECVYYEDAEHREIDRNDRYPGYVVQTAK